MSKKILSWFGEEVRFETRLGFIFYVVAVIWFAKFLDFVF